MEITHAEEISITTTAHGGDLLSVRLVISGHARSLRKAASDGPDR